MDKGDPLVHLAPKLDHIPTTFTTSRKQAVPARISHRNGPNPSHGRTSMTQAAATPITDDAALKMLLTGPETRHTSVSELAREWGWNRTRVRRRLTRWSTEGRIARMVDDEGLSTITLVAGTVNVAVLAPVVDEQNSVRPLPLDAQPSTSRVHQLGAVVLGGLALAVAYYGLQINAWYG